MEYRAVHSERHRIGVGLRPRTSFYSEGPLFTVISPMTAFCALSGCELLLCKHIPRMVMNMAVHCESKPYTGNVIARLALSY